MNSTPRTTRAIKRWTSTAIVIGSSVAVLASPLAIGTASAVTATSLSIHSGANANHRASGTSVAPQTFDPIKVVVDYTPSASTTPIDYTVTGGPDVSSPNLSGTPCALATPAAGEATCTIANNGGIGADQVIVYADLTGTAVTPAPYNGNDPSVSTTETYSGKPNAITLTPTRIPAAHTFTTEAGTCEVYKLSEFDSKPEPAGARTASITFSETVSGATPAPVFTLYNVDPTTGLCTTTTPLLSSTFTAPTETAVVSRTTGDSGTDEFGIVTTQPGTGTAVATPSDPIVPTGISDTDNVTWAPGGANAVASLTATPTSTTGYTGTTASYTLKAVDSGNNPVEGVIVSAEETSGPAVTTTCGSVTDQNGNVTCSIVNSGSSGAVAETFWVNNSCGSPPSGNLETCEPQTSVTSQFNAVPAFSTHSLTCVQQLNNAQQGQGVSNCTVPTTQHSIDFHETLKDSSGNPVPGAIVDFSAVGTLGGTGATRTGTATTDANGVATFTVSNPSPANSGDNILVSSKIGSTTLDTTTSGTWASPAASSLSVTPAVQSVTKGGAVAVTVKIVDQFGGGVATSHSLNYTVSGRNNGRVGIVTTDATGTATISYTDAGTNSGSTTDTIGVSDTASALSGSATISYINGSTTASTVTVDTSGSGTSDALCNASGHTAATNVAFTHQTEVCAVVKNSFSTPEALAGKTVTFTVSSGQVAAHGALASTSTTSYTATTDVNGVAFADVTSTKTGAQTVTATTDSVNGSGTVTYAIPTAASARNITVAPTPAKVTAGTQQKFTFTVTDQYGNGVPLVSVLVTQSGTGILTGNNTTVPTAPDGTASVLLSTQAADVGGSGSVTGNITGGNACGLAAGNPAGTTAGNCTAVATYTVAAPVVPSNVKVQAAPGGKVGTEELVAATVTNSDGTPSANVVVRYKISGANSGSGAVVTKTNGVALFGFLPKHAGTVHVVAYADVNDDQLRETTEPQNTLSFSIAKTVEKPTLRLTSAHDAVTVHVTSHPSISGATVTYYVKHHGNFTKIGTSRTGSAGHASHTFVESRGVTYTFRAKVTGKSGVSTGVSKSKSIKVKK
ncbi:MAG TPA: Ig-like domain-containing protein [Mycobacteriales bacterium]|nr:Ig-like domain-containing protein [Mycobacteriales bacterium]